MRYQMARAGWNHAPQCMLTPEQVQEFVPIMNIDKVTLRPFQSITVLQSPISICSPCSIEILKLCNVC